MKTQSPFVGAESAIHLHAEPTVHLDLVFVVDPYLWLILGGAAFLLTARTKFYKFIWATLAAILTLLVVASPRALQAFKQRKTPVMSYYSDWANWLPIMEAYEARKPGYFGTPAVNLVFALNVSLDQIFKEGLDARFKRHRALGAAVQAALKALELEQVPVQEEFAAHTLTAPRYPKGVTQADLLPKVQKAGATLAGGLHPAIRAEYFRIGHMGPTNSGDVLATIGAIETALQQCGYAFTPGTGVAAGRAASGT